MHFAIHCGERQHLVATTEEIIREARKLFSEELPPLTIKKHANKVGVGLVRSGREPR